MPRQMPGIQTAFQDRLTEAIRLAEIGEIARAESVVGSQTRRELHYSRIEFLYEMAFLRVFLAWETFLEEAFLRYLCGYISGVGAAVFLPGTTYCSTLARAERAVLGTRDYVLWHNPTGVVKRSQHFFQSSPVATVLQSHTAWLADVVAIRHRIAHSQTDARRKFDSATMSISGRRYRGARAGSFLRDRDASVNPPVRWLEKLGQELLGLARQIA